MKTNLSLLILFFLFSVSLHAQENRNAHPDSALSAIINKTTAELEKSSLAPSNLFDLQFPVDAGFLQELWVPPAPSSNRVILHIQDAHCNYEAQMNIAKLLEKLMKKYHIRLVAVEGTEGPIDTSSLGDFEDDEVKDSIVKFFMHKGKITGPEYLSIMKKCPFSLFGIEKGNVYDANLKAFKELLPIRDQAQSICNEIDKSLIELKKQIYSKDLLDLDSRFQQYQTGSLLAIKFCVQLTQEFVSHQPDKKIKELCPNIDFLLESDIFEQSLNYAEIQEEQQRLLQKLNSVLSKQTLGEMVALSLQVRLGKLTQTQYFIQLGHVLEKNAQSGSPLFNWKNDFPQINQYVEYSNIYEKIDHKKLVEEIETLIETIFDYHFQNLDQKTLFHLCNDILLMRKLFLLEMSRADQAFYRTNRSNFTFKHFMDFIEDKSKSYSLSNLEVLRKLPLEIVEKYIPSAESFYSHANQRDEILVDNTLKAMEDQGRSVAFMITGGYHTEGIKKIFRDKGIAYAILSPKITQTDSTNVYINVMNQQKSTFEEFLSQVSEEE